MANNAQSQSYDNLLKRFLQNQPAIIIPLLFPGLAHEVVEELNIELLVPPRRTDRVYKTRPQEGSENAEIVHVEFESSANGHMDERLLVYHALLLEKYHLPINSIIVYPFEVRMVTSPLKEMKGSREILSFVFQTVPLWKQDARHYVERHAVPLYGLLPTMQGTNEDLLMQAIEEMIQYYEDDENHLRDELLCFRVLLARAQRLPEAELLRVERRIRMFDPLLEQDPWWQASVARGRAEGRAEGKAEGKAEGLIEGRLQSGRNIVLKIIRKRFPSLADQAEIRTARIEQPDVLDTLIEQLLQATGEDEVLDLLKKHPTP